MVASKSDNMTHK